MSDGIFCFDGGKLRQILDEWGEAQLAKNPDLLQHHIDYMKASVLAFLYSDEAQGLRTAALEQSLNELTEATNSGTHNTTIDRWMGGDQEPQD